MLQYIADVLGATANVTLRQVDTDHWAAEGPGAKELAESFMGKGWYDAHPERHADTAEQVVERAKATPITEEDWKRPPISGGSDADLTEGSEVQISEMAPHIPPSAAGQPAGSQSSSGRPVSSQDVVVITELPVGVGEAELAGWTRETLVLTADERRWGRRRVTTTAGRTLALALPTGSVLKPGAILHVGPDWFVAVECALEPCLAVTPASREEALRVAFEVGNRHVNLALDGERLLVPDDPGMDVLLTRMNVHFERVRAPFVPIGRGQRHDG